MENPDPDSTGALRDPGASHTRVKETDWNLADPPDHGIRGTPCGWRLLRGVSGAALGAAAAAHPRICSEPLDVAEHFRFADSQPTLWNRGAGRVRDLGTDIALRVGGGEEGLED